MKYQTAYSRVSKAFGIGKESLYLAASNPSYKMLKIPKSNGEFRDVFAPNPNLKKVQRQIAEKLNKVYSPLVPSGVMGFVKIVKWAAKKRDIVSNARLHIKSKYLINLDIKDFFPSISTDMVIRALANVIHMNNDCQEILAKLITYNGTLPPGSPASPVISNLVLLQMDHNLGTYCKTNNLVYSRYVDDISISSKEKIDSSYLEYICTIIQKNGFQINTDKTKKYNKKDVKEVTGIAIHNKKMALCKDTIEEIESNIGYYHDWKQRILGQYGATDSVQTKIASMQRSIKGQLNFAKRIDGNNGKTYRSLVAKYELSIDEKSFTKKFYI